MRKSLPPSPSPRHVADAYAVRVAALAEAVVGRDGRLTAHEARRHIEIADAHRRTRRSRPTTRAVVEVARAAMLAEAMRVAGDDGRVSLADSVRMSAPFVHAFAALREIPREEDGAAAIVAELSRLATGLWFTSESDYRYDPFAVDVDPRKPLTREILLSILPWREGPTDQPEHSLPGRLRLEVSADDSFWLDEAEKDRYRATALRAIDRLMKRCFVEETIRNGIEIATAKIFSVTIPEADAALAPYFVLGRLVSGEVVGVRTFRVWT